MGVDVDVVAFLVLPLKGKRERSVLEIPEPAGTFVGEYPMPCGDNFGDAERDIELDEARREMLPDRKLPFFCCGGRVFVAIVQGVEAHPDVG